MTSYFLRTKVGGPAHNVVFKPGKTFDRIEALFVAAGDAFNTHDEVFVSDTLRVNAQNQ